MVGPITRRWSCTTLGYAREETYTYNITHWQATRHHTHRCPQYLRWRHVWSTHPTMMLTHSTGHGIWLGSGLGRIQVGSGLSQVIGLGWFWVTSRFNPVSDHGLVGLYEEETWSFPSSNHPQNLTKTNHSIYQNEAKEQGFEMYQ